jgi:hypothetical protein
VLQDDDFNVTSFERHLFRLGRWTEPVDWIRGLIPPRVTTSDSKVDILRVDQRRPALRCGACRVTVVPASSSS